MKEQIDKEVYRMAQDEEGEENARDLHAHWTGASTLKVFPFKDALPHEIHVKAVIGQIDEIKHDNSQIVRCFVDIFFSGFYLTRRPACCFYNILSRSTRLGTI